MDLKSTKVKTTGIKLNLGVRGQSWGPETRLLSLSPVFAFNTENKGSFDQREENPFITENEPNPFIAENEPNPFITGNEIKFVHSSPKTRSNLPV